MPGSMSKKENKEEEKRKNKKNREMPSKNTVIIRVYVESATSNYHRKSKPRLGTKQKQWSSKPLIPKIHGYDRKAQLLAYAQKLRRPNSQEVEWPRKNLRTKSKWSWGPSEAKLPVSWGRQWRYERIKSDARKKSEKGSCCKRTNRNRTPAGQDIHGIYTRLKCMLKELSCKCNKG